eukprot:gnl/MRDRNA2_/MRDRNA2_19015_c0_seq1.p1 gnl/MRDRNA2_/MRDRNA2_19015_c0~~gnl/MRDRNA2_/MRDRNA2_19015_c0_seq1.p1  ORF type:complete len:219 (+),score=33.19 gnl/MRDRNA2_/MRDRNA2_19015_c0_seq1:58-657(+)
MAGSLCNSASLLGDGHRFRLQKLIPNAKSKRAGSFRKERLESIYRRVLQYELEYGIRDRSIPKIRMVDLDMARGNSAVRVWVTGDASKAKRINDGLERVKGYLRSRMAQEVTIFRVPDLVFKFVEANEGELLEMEREPLTLSGDMDMLGMGSELISELDNIESDFDLDDSPLPPTPLPPLPPIPRPPADTKKNSKRNRR